jgi:hypothetical protein
MVVNSRCIGKNIQFLAILFLLLTACNSENKKGRNVTKSIDTYRSNKVVAIEKSYEALNYAKVKGPVDSTNYLLVSKSIAIMVFPDSTWFEKKMQEYGEDAWNEVVADHDYYQSEAMNSLEKAGVEVKFFDSNKRYYKFVGDGGRVFFLDRQKMQDKWGLILFSRSKEPVFWNSTQINDAIQDIYYR